MPANIYFFAIPQVEDQRIVRNQQNIAYPVMLIVGLAVVQVGWYIGFQVNVVVLGFGFEPVIG